MLTAPSVFCFDGLRCIAEKYTSKHERKHQKLPEEREERGIQRGGGTEGGGYSEKSERGQQESFRIVYGGGN